MRIRMSIAMIALVACAHASNRPDDPIVIGLDRRECYGSCPVYSLAIHASGRVEYIGMSFVKKQGEASTVLAAATLRELVAAFDAAGFDRLPEDLEGNTSDVPHLFLSYRGRLVRYSAGPRSRAGDAVVRLAEAVDRAVRIERWIGTPAEREAMFVRASRE